MTVNATFPATAYNGSAHTPAPSSVTFDGAPTSGYTVGNYRSNTAVGMASVDITGTGNYTGTATVNFTISQKALTLMADNITICVGASEPAYTYSVSGLVGSDTAAVITTAPTMSVSSFSSTSTGTFTINISGGTTTNPNYTITSHVTGTLTITVSPGGGNGVSGVNNGSATTITTTDPPTETWLTSGLAGTLAEKAIRNNQDYVRTRSNGTYGTYGVRRAAFAVLAGLRYRHDTIEGNAVQVRVCVDDPSKAAKDLFVSGYVKGDTVDRVKARFEKWFQNKVAVVSFDQQDDFGMQVQISAKVDLSGMDTNNLYFYSYDGQADKYSRIETEYWIDTNGYLHFTTFLAGEIIVSSGPLSRKTEEQMAADGNKYYYLYATPALESLKTNSGDSTFSEPTIQEAPRNGSVGCDSLSYMNTTDTPSKLEKVDSHSVGGVLIMDPDRPDVLDGSQKGGKPSALMVGGITAAILFAAMMLWAVVPRKDDSLISLEDHRKKH